MKRKTKSSARARVASSNDEALRSAIIELHQLRYARGLKQKDVARVMGTSQSRVGELEMYRKGRTAGVPKLSTLARYAAALGAALVVSIKVEVVDGDANSKLGGSRSSANPCSTPVHQ